MKKLRLFALCMAVLGLFVVLNAFETAEDTTDMPAQLAVLFEIDGEFTEFTFDLTETDLGAYFRTGLVMQMLAGERLHFSSAEDLAGIWDVVGVAEGTTVDNVWVLYGAQVPATWTCIKCCYADEPLACCCKAKDPDE